MLRSMHLDLAVQLFRPPTQLHRVLYARYSGWRRDEDTKDPEEKDEGTAGPQGTAGAARVGPRRMA